MQKKKRIRPKNRLSLDERIIIEGMLNHNDSISDIAFRLNRSKSTISREIKNHTIFVKKEKNDCEQIYLCRNKHRCGDMRCNRPCKSCLVCIKGCEDYTPHICEYKLSPPHLCNPCRQKNACKREKRLYSASQAHEEYTHILSENRKGFSLSDYELENISKIVTPLLRQGLSPYHICQTHPEIGISESTLRRIIASSVIEGRNIDLRNQVKRKQRKTNTPTEVRSTIYANKKGRQYEDYLAFQEKNDLPVVEMDCVLGCKSDVSVLLTLHFKKTHFQLAYIMDYHNSANVVDTLDMIEKTLGKELFCKMFPVILTDNGLEFSDIEGMERSFFGGKRTRIFFCEPCRSDQKGSCEKNHTMIRYIIPKGTSLEPFYQSEITLMMNHINNYCRNSLFGNSPYTFAQQFYPQEFFDKLGFYYMKPDTVRLQPSLLIEQLSK